MEKEVFLLFFPYERIALHASIYVSLKLKQVGKRARAGGWLSDEKNCNNNFFKKWFGLLIYGLERLKGQVLLKEAGRLGQTLDMFEVERS